MTAADRTVRQRAADHETHPDRVEAVTRDLLADVEYYAPNHEIRRQSND